MKDIRKLLSRFLRCGWCWGNYYDVMFFWGWRRKWGRCDSPQEHRTITRTRSFFGEFNCVLCFYLSSTHQQLGTVCLSVCQCRLVLCGGKRGIWFRYIISTSEWLLLFHDRDSDDDSEWSFCKRTMGDDVSGWDVVCTAPTDDDLLMSWKPETATRQRQYK